VDADIPEHSTKAAPSPRPQTAAARAPSPAQKPAPGLAPLDRRLKQRLARGSEPIDARLDLHGRTQGEAHAALLRFLRRAQADGAKFVLVITGKGARADDAEQARRAQAPSALWLRLPNSASWLDSRTLSATAARRFMCGAPRAGPVERLSHPRMQHDTADGSAVLQHGVRLRDLASSGTAWIGMVMRRFQAAPRPRADRCA
jgi:hypothetical protein